MHASNHSLSWGYETKHKNTYEGIQEILASGNDRSRASYVEAIAEETIDGIQISKAT